MDIRTISSDDDVVLAAELRASFQESDRRSSTVDYYRWKYSTEGSHFVGAFEGPQLLSIAGVCRKPFDLSTPGVLAFEIGDTFTHPTGQRRGLFSALVGNCIEHLDSLGERYVVYGTPNANSRPPYIGKLGFMDWPSSCVQVVGSTSWRDLKTWSGRGSIASRSLSAASHLLSSIGGRRARSLTLSTGRDLGPATLYHEWRYGGHPDEYLMLRDPADRLSVVKTLEERGVVCTYVVEAADERGLRQAAAVGFDAGDLVTGWVPRRLVGAAVRAGLFPVRNVPWISRSNLNDDMHVGVMREFLAERGFIGFSDNV